LKADYIDVLICISIVLIAWCIGVN